MNFIKKQIENIFYLNCMCTRCMARIYRTYVINSSIKKFGLDYTQLKYFINKQVALKHTYLKLQSLWHSVNGIAINKFIRKHDDY